MSRYITYGSTHKYKLHTHYMQTFVGYRKEVRYQSLVWILKDGVGWKVKLLYFHPEIFVYTFNPKNKIKHINKESCNFYETLQHPKTHLKQFLLYKLQGLLVELVQKKNIVNLLGRPQGFEKFLWYRQYNIHPKTSI